MRRRIAKQGRSGSKSVCVREPSALYFRTLVWSAGWVTCAGAELAAPLRRRLTKNGAGAAAGGACLGAAVAGSDGADAIEWRLFCGRRSLRCSGCCRNLRCCRLGRRGFRVATLVVARHDALAVGAAESPKKLVGSWWL